MQTHIDTLYFVAAFTMGMLTFHRSSNVDSLVKDIEANGLYTPLVAYEESDGCYLVLRGSRRLTAIRKIRDESPERFDVLFPEGLIPVVRPR